MLRRRNRALADGRGLGSGSRRRATAGLTGAAIAAAVAVGGCGSTTTSPPVNDLSPAATIARAADVSGAAQGGMFRMNIAAKLPGAGTMTIDAHGFFSAPSRSLKMTMNMHVAGRTMKIHEVKLGSKLYVEMPAALTSKMPGGKSWLMMDTSKLSKQSYLGGLSSLSEGQPMSPTGSLTYLKAESEHVAKLGPASVSGVQTTHYRLTINLKKAGAGMPASTRATIRRVLRQMPAKILDETRLPVDVWIDSSQLVRKMKLVMRVKVSSVRRPFTESLTLAVPAYGPEPTPSRPPAGQTLNLLALLRAENQSTTSASG